MDTPRSVAASSIIPEFRAAAPNGCRDGPGRATVSLGDGLTSHPARGHGRLLCVRGAARRSRAAREAGDRRRHGRARRRRGGELRSAPVRRAFGHARARGAAALPGCDLRAAAHRALRRGVAADLRDLPRVHAAGAGAVAGRGVPRRHGEHRGARRRDARSPARSSGGCASERSSRRRSASRRTSWWPRSPPTCASPTVSWSCGPDEIRELLDPLPIRKLFGLGAKTAPKVEALGIHTLGELRAASASRLRPVFGRYTERVQQRAAGIDDRPVIPDADEKQISAEETFETDIADHAAPAGRDRSPRGQGVRAPARPGTLRALRHREDPPRRTSRPTRASDASSRRRRRRASITAIATALLDAWLATQPRAALRLLGVGVSELARASATRPVLARRVRPQPATRPGGGRHSRAVRQAGRRTREQPGAPGRRGRRPAPAALAMPARGRHHWRPTHAPGTA